MNRHSMGAAAGVLLAALALAPAASAATTHFVTPTGPNTAACTELAPCDLAKAATIAAAGDTIQLAPGNHTVVGALISAPNVEVVGAPGATRPKVTLVGPASVLNFAPTAGGGKVRNLEIVSSTGGLIGVGSITAAAPITLDNLAVTSDAACASLTGTGSTITNSTFTQTTGGALPSGCISTGANATLRNVTVSSTGAFPTGAVLLNGDGNTVDNLKITGTGGLAVGNVVFPSSGTPSTLRRLDISTVAASGPFVSQPALGLFGPAVVTDSLLRSNGTGGFPGIPTAAVNTAADARLRNVTAVASGTGAQAILVQPAATPKSVSIKNSILRGDAPANDLAAGPGAPGISIPPGCTIVMPGCITTPTTVAGNVTVDHSNLRGVTGTVTQTANQTDDPQFTNAVGGDFRPKEGSPAVDAGVDDADNGSTDLAGVTRKQGAAVDIGAFEFPVAPAAETPQQPSTPSGGGEIVVEPPAPDRLAPGLSALALTNKTFAVAASATPVAARAKKGTTFVYTLSEPATTAITIERATTGRRKGKSCVKATSKNAKARKCTLYVKAGALTREGRNGANAVPFSGRIGKKALKPATYRASFVAVDAAGNKSQSKSVGFKVVKK